MHELGVDDLDQLLARRKALADFLAERPVLDPVDEGLDDRQGDVGFEQREPYLPQSVLDVGFGQPALAAQLPRGVRQTPGQILEHPRIIPVPDTIYRV